MEKQLIEAGYKKYQNYDVNLYQKAFKHENKIKYFINIKDYFIEENKQFYFEIHLYKNKLITSIKIIEFESIESVETFIEDLWKKMNMDYDKLNN